MAYPFAQRPGVGVKHGGLASFGRGMCPVEFRKLGFWAVSAAILGMLLGIAIAAPLSGAARPTTGVLLPETTAVLLWVPDVPDAGRRFLNTGLGRLYRDAEMRGVVGAFFRSLSQSLEAGRLGLSLAELMSLPRGELALAVVPSEKGAAAVVVLMDTGDQASKARTLLDGMVRGAGVSERRVRGTRGLAYSARRGERPDILFFERAGRVVVSTDRDVLERILAAWDGQRGGTLATNRNFGDIMRRCRERNPKPQFAWYVDPLLLLKVTATQNPPLRVGLGLFPLLGLDGVKAAGGGIEWDAGRLDSTSHMHLVLDSPRRGLLGLLAFRSGDVTPEHWVPANVSTYTTVHWDVQTALAAAEELFDTFRGEGAFSELIHRVIEEPTGVDFQADVLPLVTGRMTHLTRLPTAGTGEGGLSLLAWELRDAPKAQPVLERMVAPGELLLARRSFAGKQYYEFSLPALGEAAEEARLGPRPCFGLLDGYLIVAEQPSLYEALIAAANGSAERLVDSSPFKLIAREIQQRSGGPKPVLFRYQHPAVGMERIYQMATARQTRATLRQQAERNIFSRALSAAVETGRLPPFAALEKYLAPSGGLLTVDGEGLHYTGFTLRPEAVR